MSTKYKHGDAIPIDVIARRLEELSDAVVARMNCDNAKFEREFTCRIPAELDRDADVVLSEASLRLSKQQERIAELEEKGNKHIEICERHVSTRRYLEKRIAELDDIVSVLTIADETGYVDGEGFVVGFNQITDDAREFLAKHNLEQQAKGIEDFIEPYATRGSFGQVVYDSGLKKAFTLRNQAKQLREQAKGGAE
jgi:predicted peroxiredoxin